MTLLRVFIAVDITDDRVRRSVQEVQQKLVEAGADVKLVEPENLHITLRFIGEVSKSVVDQIAQKMRDLRYKCFQIRIKGLGVFPSISSPRVVWAGVVDGASELVELHNIVEQLVGRYGVKDERQFVPHLTIARVRSSRNRHVIADLVREYEGFEFGSQSVSEVKLKRSVLTPSGPIYSDLVTVRLC